VGEFGDNIWIIFLVCDPKKVGAQWMPLLIWDAVRLNTLRVAFWIGTAVIMTPVEIIVPLKFMMFIWCQ
jgi:hypothetical protein